MFSFLPLARCSTLDKTSCSRVEVRAPDDRQLGLRSDLALAVGMHGASGEPGDEIDPDLLPRHRGEHVAVGAHTGTVWLVELSHGVSKTVRSTDRVALRVLVREPERS